MITELKSVRDIWRDMPSDRHARISLEEMIWPSGRRCPHCGRLNSTPIRCRSVRPGLYHCSERECRLQFTVTTKTPMHATQQDLRTWIAAIFLVLMSSKGISSVVMARILGGIRKQLGSWAMRSGNLWMTARLFPPGWSALSKLTRHMLVARRTSRKA